MDLKHHISRPHKGYRNNDDLLMFLYIFSEL